MITGAIKNEIDNMWTDIWSVISMPGGVFKPYGGISAAVPVTIRASAGGTGQVWFYVVKADDTGSDHGGRIEEIEGNAMMYNIGEIFTLTCNGAQNADDTGYPITRIEK